MMLFTYRYHMQLWRSFVFTKPVVFPPNCEQYDVFTCLFPWQVWRSFVFFTVIHVLAVVGLARALTSAKLLTSLFGELFCLPECVCAVTPVNQYIGLRLNCST